MKEFFSKFFLICNFRSTRDQIAIFTLIAKIPSYSIVSFIGVYGPKFTKFPTLVKHSSVCLPWKFDRGYSRKFLENRKNLKFSYLHMLKRLPCFIHQRSKVKFELPPCRPFTCGSTAVLRAIASNPNL